MNTLPGRTAALVVVMVVASQAWAASRIVLLRGPGSQPLLRQAETLLEGELRAVGFEVVRDSRGGERDVRAALDAAATRLSPAATVAMLPTSDASAVELWVHDRVTGKVVIRRIETAGASDEGAAAASLALRAVELLRGSLLEIAAERPASSASPPADVARFVGSVVRERPAYFQQGLGIGVGGSVIASGLGATWAPLLRLSWGHRRGLGARVTLVTAGTERRLFAAEGRGTVTQDLGLAEGFAVFRAHSILQPFVTVGGGLQRVQARGEGVSSLFPDSSGTGYAGVLTAGTGLALRLGRYAALVGDFQLLLAPHTRVLIANQVQTRAGGLTVLGSMGLATYF